MTMSATVKIDTGNFQSEVMQSDVPVLVDFGATWCGPCQALKPIVEALATEYAGTVKIGEVDIDQSGDLASRFGVMSVPTLILFRDGEIVDKQIGLLSKNDLKKRIETAMAR
jgi:thioredoxin 1